MKYFTSLFLCLCCVPLLNAQNVGTTREKTPSKSQYFSWINNTNEGSTEEQTLANLDFFKWLHDSYGMKLDIYAFDAGVIDGKNFYGSMQSDRFKRNFPNGFKPAYEKAKQMNTRLGLWGGPDGFGNSEADAQKRINEMSGLCKDFNWGLFKFDAVCGPLRPDQEGHFIKMMEECRKYSPDLILLNHRLGLKEAQKYATTFLWEGQETYIDVHMGNHFTAPYNRACVLKRGIVPGLQRLTEDHGVCLSSCLDYWEDDLVLQAFNRSLILSPELYGNPWLLSDSEFARLARYFNLCRKYSKILVNGMTLPESYGPFAISRGDNQNRIITMRNDSWNYITRKVVLNKEIGLTKGSRVEVRQYHPTDKIIGTYKYGETVNVTIPPFRAYMLYVSSNNEFKDPAIEGVDFEVVRDIPTKPLEINVLGYPGETYSIKLKNVGKHGKITIDGNVNNELMKGAATSVSFPGEKLKQPINRQLCSLSKTDAKVDVNALYEATVFSADNNALEVRSLKRSGETNIPEVKKARDEFFNQSTFVERELWDKYMFDGDMSTGFRTSCRYKVDQKVNGGCFRLDLGKVMKVDSIVFKTNSFSELEPLLKDEGSFAYVSTDLTNWSRYMFIANLKSVMPVNSSMRYLRMSYYPTSIKEIEVYSNGKKVDSKDFRASNLFADSRRMKCAGLWSSEIVLDQIPPKSYLSVAINGKHGKEGAYAALKFDGKLVGAPTRSVSYPANTWEYANMDTDSNYTYYIPLDESMKNKKIEVYVMGYNEKLLDLKPVVYLSTEAFPQLIKKISIERK